MDTQPTVLPELESERFVEVIDLVRRRLSDPEAAQRLETDPDIAPVWAAYQKALDDVVRVMNSRMRYFRPGDYKRHAIGRQMTGRRAYGQYFAAQAEGLFTPALAIVLGEVGRVARMEPDQLATYQLAPTALHDGNRLALGEERRLEALYPLVAVASDVFLRHPRPKVEPGQGGLPLDVVMRALRDLDTLQDRIAANRKKSPIVTVNLGTRIVASLGQSLATREFLDQDNLAAAFQVCYDEHWHTNPKTKTASGAFVEELREWTRREGKGELLVVLAASSDGRNRAVAGSSVRTPLPVYDKMIYDNALAVLAEVVQNHRFDDARAYAMMKTNGAPQLAAVMLHGRVNLSIRALACEKAIQHPGVDPYHIYAFLRGHASHADQVPHAYWRDFVFELRTRLETIRLKGTEKQVNDFETRVKRFTTAFVTEVLKPYADAAKTIAKVEASGREPVYHSQKRELAEAREFVRCHEFVKDPEILDIVLETEQKKDEIVAILQHCVDAGIPVTQKLMVSALQHDDREVRETAMGLLPNVKPDEVEKAAAELNVRMQADKDAVRDKVLTDVIPDFEDIDGILRRRSANHHYFEAADELSEQDLVDVFQRCYEKNPTTIPEAFYQATMLRRYEARYTKAAEEQREVPESQEPMGPMVQADLFGGTLGLPDASGKVEQMERKSSRTTRR